MKFLLSSTNTDARGLPLRERKYARTKLALLRAALERLARQSFDEISVRELCASAEISEASFFNYFPKKTDLLAYFVQLWSIEVTWHAQRAANGESGLAAIDNIFAYTGRELARSPRIMSEIIVHQARMDECATLPEITRAERLLAFGDLEGIETVPALGLDAILLEQLGRAVRLGELPAGTNTQTLMLTLAAVFFGVPLLVGRKTPELVVPLYREQLTAIFAAFRGAIPTARGAAPTSGPRRRPPSPRKRRS